jgi:TonB family protein
MFGRTPESNESSRGPSESRARDLRALLEASKIEEGGPLPTRDKPRTRSHGSGAFRYPTGGGLTPLVAAVAVLGAAAWLAAQTGALSALGGWVPKVVRTSDPDSPPPAKGARPSTTSAAEPARATAPHVATPVTMAGSGPTGQPDAPNTDFALPPDSGLPLAGSAERGTLDVVSPSSSVPVEIAGVLKARTPLNVTLPAGSYVVRVGDAEGAPTHIVQIEPGRSTRLSVGAPSPGRSTPRAPAPMTEAAALTRADSHVARLDLPAVSIPEPPAVERPREAPTRGAAETIPARPIAERVPPLPSPFPHRRGARIVLDLVIDEEGRVAAATIRESSAPSLDGALLSAVRGWRYEPASSGGVPVRSTRTVEVPLATR